MSSYYNILIEIVLDLSDSKEWEVAVNEWKIDKCEEDDNLETSCVCGKENLRYLFTIVNSQNGNTLYPIGSSCIKKFDRHDLNDVTTIYEKLFILFRAIENNEFIKLSPEFFSRKVIKYLYEEGAFLPSSYNNNHPETDYEFLLKMFNKKNKDAITQNQGKKIRAIIISSIKPYLVNKLKSR